VIDAAMRQPGDLVRAANAWQCASTGRVPRAIASRVSGRTQRPGSSPVSAGRAHSRPDCDDNVLFLVALSA